MKVRILADHIHGVPRGTVKEALQSSDKTATVIFTGSSKSAWYLAPNEFEVVEEVEEAKEPQSAWFGQPMSKLQVEFK